MLNYLNALKYPITNIKSFVIGALLTLFSILFIPFLLVQGYVVKIIRETNKGSDFMPEWEDWKTLLFDGFFVFAIEVVYLLPSLLLVMTAVLITPQSLASMTTSGAIPNLGTPTIVLILLSIVIAFLASILLPVAIITYALTKEFKSAIDVVTTIKTVLMNPLYYISNLIISAIMMSILLIMTIITSFLLLPLLFYPIVITFRILSGWFTESP
jgi:hypothetical protein